MYVCMYAQCDIKVKSQTLYSTVHIVIFGCHYIFYHLHMTKLCNDAVYSDTPWRCLKTIVETCRRVPCSLCVQFVEYVVRQSVAGQLNNNKLCCSALIPSQFVRNLTGLCIVRAAGDATAQWRLNWSLCLCYRIIKDGRELQINFVNNRTCRWQTVTSHFAFVRGFF